MIEVTSLPTVNATLNSLSAVLLFAGYRFIKAGKRSAHRTTMLAACGSSTLFLIFYLIYHYHVGSVPFRGQGWIRTVYFTILISHTVLATAVVPLAIVTLIRGLREDFNKHRRIARWTFPIWLYVSVTGVVVYCMLYGFMPSN
ncbi:MAG: DUF420 domain-containing protein [Candidatus Binatia bacterium]